MNNRYYRSNRRRSTNANYNAMNVHFDNISMLANIIQDSQKLLEASNHNTNNRWSTPLSMYQATEPYYVFMNQPMRNRQPDTSNDASTNPINSTPYSIRCVDSPNQEQFNGSNVDLLDVQEYQFIDNPLNDICPIAREAFSPTQNVMMIARCKHIFFKSFLETWILNHNTCPSCRSHIGLQ